MQLHAFIQPILSWDFYYCQFLEQIQTHSIRKNKIDDVENQKMHENSNEKQSLW